MNKNKLSINELVPSELLQLLGDIAFVAINKGFIKESQEIFDAIIEARPTNLYAKQAKGVALIFSGKITEGTKILFDVLSKDPTNEWVKSFLSIAFKLTNVHDYAKAAAKSVVDFGKDKDAKKLSQTILESYQDLQSLEKLNAYQSSRVSTKA